MGGEARSAYRDALHARAVVFRSTDIMWGIIKKILLVLFIVWVAILSYRCYSMCCAICPTLVQEEENRGITVADTEGVEIAIYRDGRRGAPNEKIVLRKGGAIMWCGIAIKEKDGGLHVNFRNQEEKIYPDMMKSEGANGEERKIYHNIILDEDGSSIRHQYGILPEPPCVQATMSTRAFLKMGMMDYFENYILSDIILLLQLTSVLLILILLIFLPIHQWLFRIYAILTINCEKERWTTFEEDSTVIRWKRRNVGTFGFCSMRGASLILLDMEKKLCICSAHDVNWIVFEENIKRGYGSIAIQDLMNQPPRMLSYSASILRKIIFALSA